MSEDFPVGYTSTFLLGFKAAAVLTNIKESFSSFSVTHYGLISFRVMEFWRPNSKSSRKTRIKIRHCLRDTHLAGSPKSRNFKERSFWSIQFSHSVVIDSF